jgi:hypothetical protein
VGGLEPHVHGNSVHRLPPEQRGIDHARHRAPRQRCVVRRPANWLLGPTSAPVDPLLNSANLDKLSVVRIPDHP